MKLEEKTRYIILIVLGILIFMLAFSYAYFIAELDDSKSFSVYGVTKTVDQFLIIQGNPISLQLDQQSFGKGKGNVVCTITSIAKLIANNNTSSASKEYYVYFYVGLNEYDYSSFEQEPEVILTIKNPSGNNVTSVPGLTYVTRPDVSGFDITNLGKGPIVIASKYSISTTNTTTGTDQTWQATITVRNMDFQQINLIGKRMSAQFIIASEELSMFGAGSVILANNLGKDLIDLKQAPTFTGIANSNEGMFKDLDPYGDSYYFRGTVNNNWAKFAGFYWRIVRINGDGSIKLIYSGTTAPTSGQAIVMTGTGSRTGTSGFGLSTSMTEYAGYMYKIGVHRGYENNSVIKNSIDTWYENNLLDYTEYIEDTVYCNDRSMYTTDGFESPVSGTGLPSTGRWNYGARNRLYPKDPPTFMCGHKNDYFTVDDTVNGNGALTYPIALLSIDEAAYAGGIAGVANSSYYLYTGYDYWTMSPYFSSTTSTGGFRVAANGSLSTGSTTISNVWSIRPVISIKSWVNITGSGLYNDPYEFNI